MLELAQGFILFLLLNIVVFLTVNTIIWRYFETEMRGIFDWLIMLSIFFASEILIVLGLVGFLGYLNILGVIVGVLVCLIFGGLRLPFLGRNFNLGAFAALRKLRQFFFQQDKKEGKDWIWAVFGFLVLFGMVELFNAFIQFPWEYDTLAYHMPFVVEWFKSETLWNVFYAVWGGPLGYYPSSHELLTFWFLLPFSADYLVNLINFWIVGVMIIVIYKILREMGVTDFLAWLAGALVMVMPIFLRQIGTGQVDVLLALGVIISWYYFLRTYKRGDGVLMIPLLLSIAIMLGTKYLSVVYVIPILVVFFFLASIWKKTHRFWWLWFIVILGTLGSMWYLRNLILTGNPIFPADFRIGETVIFEGYRGLTERIQQLSLWHRITQSGQLTEWFTAMTKETGWHLYLVVIAYLLLVIEMVYKLLFSKMKRGEGKIYTLMLFFLPAYWYLYFIAPYTASMMEHNVRYAMPWLLLSMLMVLYVVYKLGELRKVFVMALMGVVWWQFLSLVSTERSGDQAFLEFGFVYDHPWLFVLLFVVIIFFFLSFDAWRKKYVLRYGVFTFTIILTFFFFLQLVTTRSAVRAESWQHKFDFPIMKVYEWIDENVPSDAVIANSLNPLYYPLYGETLERRVLYVNINDCTECDYYSYQEQGKTLRNDPSYEAWRKNLELQGVEYILLGYSIKEGLEEVRPYELEWVKQYPQDFMMLFQEDEVFVYKIEN